MFNPVLVCLKHPSELQGPLLVVVNVGEGYTRRWDLVSEPEYGGEISGRMLGCWRFLCLTVSEWVVNYM